MKRLYTETRRKNEIPAGLNAVFVIEGLHPCPARQILQGR